MEEVTVTSPMYDIGFPVLAVVALVLVLLLVSWLAIRNR
jgi:hypothetical protein